MTTKSTAEPLKGEPKIWEIPGWSHPLSAGQENREHSSAQSLSHATANTNPQQHCPSLSWLKADRFCQQNSRTCGSRIQECLALRGRTESRSERKGPTVRPAVGQVKADAADKKSPGGRNRVFKIGVAVTRILHFNHQEVHYDR